MTTINHSIKKSKAVKNKLSSVNMNEAVDEYIVYVAVPGMLRGDISIFIQANMLVMSAAKKEALHCYMDSEKQDFAKWSEEFVLPADADTLMTAAVYRNGELEIHIPKGGSNKSKEKKEIFVY